MINIEKKIISIILATYNSEEYLNQTLNSIRKQTNNNYELIIIDGGSKDNTIEIIKNNIDIVSYFISEPDDGIYSAWNKGIIKSKGDWIGFIGSDDLLFEDTIQNYYEYIITNNLDKMDLINSKIIITDKRLKYLKTIGEEWNWEKFKKNTFTSHVMMLHNKNLFKKYGLFDSTYKIVGDSEFLLRIGNKINTSFMNKETVLVRYGGASLSFKALKEIKKAKIKLTKRVRIFIELEYFVSFILLIRYKFLTIFKNLFI